MVSGVNGQNGHLVQNLVGVVLGDDIASAATLHQLMEANPVLELMDNRNIATKPHVQFMESGKLFTHTIILDVNLLYIFCNILSSLIFMIQLNISLVLQT